MNSGLRLEHECKINGSLLAVEGSKPRQKQDRNFIWKPSTKHLRRRNWEVYVVDTREKNASCLLGGRIVIYKGLLDTLKSDAELATVIGHEVGHAVARHIAEAIVRLIWILAILIVAFCAFLFNGNSTSREDANDGLQRISALFVNFISRRREAEADYIGLMLMASAGYNPQVAPRVFEKKIGGKGGIDSTHPSGINRAKVLNEPKVMNKALVVYKEVKAGEGVRSFV
uniref:Peptidase M48 domain-containing protein n=1 Tax=Fagus sylvatica TaxID=28930 RepID=A0A2N9J9C7_FAGSY